MFASPPSWLKDIQRYLPPPSKTPAEESIPLRVLVQVLVCIGILATDVAYGAFEAGKDFPVSLWTVPVSLLGAVFSWYRRKERNILVKFLLAIAMLAALGVFFLNILGTPNDTRIGLALLLIHLQVIHSFDLPRRRDLGYSMAIGLVLLGVAATLSQTLAFAPWLVAFVVVAVPMLLYDYRSRLGLATPKSLQIPWGLLFLLTAGSLGLGGLIFALLPRFPGYQLRAFPVSANLPVPKDFNAKIRNRGFPAELAKGGNSSQDKNKGSSRTTALPTAYFGFNEEIGFNVQGVLEPALMMRVRSQGASFWRVMAFDFYTGTGWRVGSNRTVPIYRQPPYGIIYLPTPPTKAKIQPIVQTFTMVGDLPNLVPAAPWPNELYFPTEQVAVDPMGTVRAPVELVQGLTYTVVSAVPKRDRKQLRNTGAKYPPGIQASYLQLPATVSPRVGDLARRVTQDAPGFYEKVLTLTQYLKQTYPLQTTTPPYGPKRDLADAFLFGSKGGTPEHFATTEVVMLRSMGIPARLVTGFMPGKFNPWTGYYEVWNTDATAVVEAYFEGMGWFSFDPVPGRDLIPPQPDQTETFSVADQTWKGISQWIPEPLRLFIGSLIAGVAGFLVTIFAWAGLLVSSLGWVGGAILIALTVAITFAGWGAFQAGTWWVRQQKLVRLPPAERRYQEMLRLAAGRGLLKMPQDTPLEFLRQLQQTIPHGAAACGQITHNYLRWRYQGAVIAPEEATAAYQALRQALKTP